jgi:retron-type reverse transcriptase
MAIDRGARRRMRFGQFIRRCVRGTRISSMRTCRRRSRMSTQLEQIAAKAKADRTLRFTSLAHLLTPGFLIETWRQMNRRGASGVDGETTTEFERELETRVQDICARLKAGTYRAPPVRRVETPKGPGKVGTRPLGIPTVEDRLVQRLSRAFSMQCSKRTFWTARMDFDQSAARTTRCAH